MDDSKSEGKIELPEWLAENKQFRTLLQEREASEASNRQKTTKILDTSQKYNHVAKVNPKEAERMHFKWVYLLSWWKGRVKLLKWVKIALLFLHVTSKPFQCTILNLSG